MKKLTIDRVAQHLTFGTFGVFLNFEGIPFAVTLELPWRNNQKNISCIPATLTKQGKRLRKPYLCKRTVWKGAIPTWMVTGVPNRSLIKMHSGATHKDTQGCIVVAEMFGNIGGIPGVQISRSQPGLGFHELISITAKEDRIELDIISDIAQEKEVLIDSFAKEIRPVLKIRGTDRKIPKYSNPEFEKQIREIVKNNERRLKVADFAYSILKGIEDARKRMESSKPRYVRVIGKIFKTIELVMKFVVAINLKRI